MSNLGDSRLTPSSWVPEEPGADEARLRSSAAEGNMLAGEAVLPSLSLGTSAHGAEHHAKIPGPAQAMFAADTSTAEPHQGGVVPG